MYQVINFYVGLMQERLMRLREGGAGAPNVHFFTSFFYAKLFADDGAYNYQNVRRWTTNKKLGG